jgi:hypothetical protein
MARWIIATVALAIVATFATAASGSTVLAAVYSSATSMTVTIPASLLQRAGTIPITVTNPPNKSPTKKITAAP